MSYAIKCGHCKGTHGTVEQVKECHGNAGVAVKTVVKPVEPIEMVEAAITSKQETFLNTLLDARPMFRDVENLWPNNIAKLTKAQASKKIEEVLKVAVEVKKTSNHRTLTAMFEGIDDGYFALPCKTGNNDLDFIRIGTNQGKFNPADKGKRRIQRFIGGQGPIQMQYAEQIVFANAIVAMTAEERSAAKELFGRELGQCGCCGKPLTDQDSRAKGIGPVCDGKAY